MRFEKKKKRLQLHAKMSQGLDAEMDLIQKSYGYDSHVRMAHSKTFFFTKKRQLSKGFSLIPLENGGTTELDEFLPIPVGGPHETRFSTSRLCEERSFDFL